MIESFIVVVTRNSDSNFSLLTGLKVRHVYRENVYLDSLKHIFIYAKVSLNLILAVRGFYVNSDVRIINVNKECYCYAEALVVPFSLKKKNKQTNEKTKKKPKTYHLQSHKYKCILDVND